jgi:hypothetical protein
MQFSSLRQPVRAGRYARSVPHDSEDFRAEVRRMMRSYAPSDGDNLLGMEIDLVGRLSGLAALNSTSVSVRRTADPKALIVAECETANGCTVDQAMRAVTQAWLGDIGYSYSESHHVTTSTEVGVFEGLTQIGPGGFFVTCRVTIRGHGA